MLIASLAFGQMAYAEHNVSALDDDHNHHSGECIVCLTETSANPVPFSLFIPVEVITPFYSIAKTTNHLAAFFPCSDAIRAPPFVH